MNSDQVMGISTAVDYDPFADAPLARVVATTEPQREIWLAAKLEREASLAYNESVSLHLSGALDVAALQTSLRALVDRHEILRATLSKDGEELHIATQLELPCPLHDLSTLGEAARETEIAAALSEVVNQPFDLEHGPLVRAQLLRLASDRHLLIFTAHHIVCDGWSFGVIVQDLAALYTEQLGQGPGPGAADSYVDFAQGQALLAQTDAGREAEGYWLARFAAIPPALDLPTDHPRQRRRSFASRREDRTLDAALIADIKKMGARRGTSFYATLLAAFGVLLQRLSGQDDVVIGIPCAGQAAGGHDALVGHCVNVLPLHASIDTQASFATVLNSVRGDLLDAFEHQQYTPCPAIRVACRWSACCSIWTRHWTSKACRSLACVSSSRPMRASSRTSSCSSMRCRSMAACAWNASTTAICFVARRFRAGSMPMKPCCAARSPTPIRRRRRWSFCPSPRGKDWRRCSRPLRPIQSSSSLTNISNVRLTGRRRARRYGMAPYS
jgi:hypothetical protein